MCDNSLPIPITERLNNISIKSAEIKQYILSKTNKKSVSEISLKNDISTKKTISKEYLAASVIEFIDLVDKLDASIKPIIDSDILDVVDVKSTNMRHEEVQKQINHWAEIAAAAECTLKEQKVQFEQQLLELRTIANSLSVPVIRDPSVAQNSIADNEHEAEVIIDHGIKCIKDSIENFITCTTHDELCSYLSQQTFTGNNEYNAITYGESFHNGVNTTKPIPTCISTIMNKVNSLIEGNGANYKLNSCKVLKFDENSSLSMHSENDSSINPESNIFTLSLGSPRTLMFRDKLSGLESTHVVNPISLYIMSRNSQNFFTHCIRKDSLNNGTNYSLIFKCVSHNFKNSTCIIGDSNTKGIKFGVGKGTVGERYPGKQVYSPVIENIDPVICASYHNIVLSLGVNDIRQPNVKDYSNIRQIYSQFKSKVNCIQKLNPRARIFVVPVLPTGSEELNVKVVDYNRLMIRDLPQAFYSVSIVHGVPRFLDSKRNILKGSLFRKHGDILHINAAGHGLLVKLIKDSIFYRNKGEVDGRSYSSSLKSGLGEVSMT